jgi:hypothetical protein
MNQEAGSAAIDATIAAVGWNTTKAGAGTTLIGWLLSSEGTALLGILIGVIGLCIQWYYKHKQDRREQREHEARMGMYE